ncbi:ABC transporter permease [Flavilitoribacter nigricans]|uniref:ABC transporter permease n=1 Tax=Flavilitoribacter nigricans (strain ATCC 23147 / DSM 23189 / NBRC 102662 / NCIMB 1420 / SS-2) TaxID=1122177 RepID=A0A2D0NBZ2_FLAN2|nr:ABC transporter permease [Flavilitoribacter nigricans]PHN05293.1 hypothetical protein CRP01_17405 [Flavilitoribacter nigricans DSM 23189 = NBRC 102662]
MSELRPPRFFLRFFRWFCDPQLHRFIEGDLLELYGERVVAMGRKKADLYFIRDVLLLFRPGIVRSFRWPQGVVGPFRLLGSYFKIFRRNFRRQPTYNLLNLSCLSLGIAAAICIGLYLDFESSYDRNHRLADRIFRIETRMIKTHEKVMDVNWSGSPANLAPLALQDYPEIEAYVRFFSFFSNEVRLDYGGEMFETAPDQVIAVDSNVFELFSFDLLRGDPTTALRGPGKVVISESMARRIFGTADPMGKVLRTRLDHRTNGEERAYPLEVSGVYRDLPRNTHLFFEAMISAETDPDLDNYYFGRFNVYTYLLLRENIAPENVAPKLTGIYDRYLDAQRDEVLVHARHELVPLPRIHYEEAGGSTYLLIFGGIGLLLLLIAFIGYVNLVTAQAGRRAREIGMRKILGSGRSQLILQFLAESLFLTLLAVLAAVLIVVIAIDPLNALLDLHLDATRLIQPQPLLILLAVTLGLGMIGGSYPAFFLSSFKVLGVLQNSTTRSAPLQQWLLGFQFAVVIFVLISTGMIDRQLDFLREKDLGFDREQILQVQLPGGLSAARSDLLQTTLARDPDIESVAGCDFVPGLGGMVNRPVSAQAAEPQFIRSGRIDHRYLQTMGIELVAGRNFSPDFPADSTEHVLVNETFVRSFGLGEEALGALVKFGGWGNPHAYRVVGIVRDFHQSSLHTGIEPQLFRLGPVSGNLVLKISGDPSGPIRHLEQTWNKLFPDQYLQYSFLDEDLQNRYVEDQRRGHLFLLFSLITIFIAFAGLYGLAAYLTGRRTREIGIRKVLGADLPAIVILISRSFVILVLLAALPGVLLGWITVRMWLENFAFRADMSWGLIGLVLLSVLLLVLCTVGWQAIRTAARNPKEVLH